MQYRKYRFGTHKCVCTHVAGHLEVGVCIIVNVSGGYSQGTQNCGCLAPLHGYSNPLQQVVVRQKFSSLHLKSASQLLKEGQGLLLKHSGSLNRHWDEKMA